MLIKMAFFEGDQLLVRGEITCSDDVRRRRLEACAGQQFEIAYRFEEPACLVSVTCSLAGEQLYRSAIMVGVHDSEDWESNELAENHVLAFRCYATSH